MTSSRWDEMFSVGKVQLGTMGRPRLGLCIVDRAHLTLIPLTVFSTFSWYFWSWSVVGQLSIGFFDTKWARPNDKSSSFINWLHYHVRTSSEFSWSLYLRLRQVIRIPACDWTIEIQWVDKPKTEANVMISSGEFAFRRSPFRDLHV